MYNCTLYIKQHSLMSWFLNHLPSTIVVVHHPTTVLVYYIYNYTVLALFRILQLTWVITLSRSCFLCMSPWGWFIMLIQYCLKSSYSTWTHSWYCTGHSPVVVCVCTVPPRVRRSSTLFLPLPCRLLPPARVAAHDRRNVLSAYCAPGYSD